jgi:hypothetical protein
MVNPWLELADLDSPSDPYAEYAIDMASFVLWSLSGRKYSGTRTITEQYVCPQSDLPIGCTQIDTNIYYNPAIGVNSYVLPSYLFSTSSIGTRFKLRQKPVRSISSVHVAGTEIPSGSYYIRNSSELVITTLASLCEGPLVTYTYGVKPPFAGKLAAIELANNFVRAYNGLECDLPERVQSIQRQGLSIEMLDPEQFLDNNRTGLYKVDLFLQAANPGKSLKPAKVFSPDFPRGYTRR